MLEWRYPGRALASVLRNLPEVLAGHVLLSERLAVVVEIDRPGNRFVQVWAANDVFVVECVSNRFLGSEELLAPWDELHLLDIGFDPPESEQRPNWWWRGEGRASIVTACKLVERVVRDVFGLRLNDRVDLIERHLGPKQRAAFNSLTSRSALVARWPISGRSSRTRRRIRVPITGNASTLMFSSQPPP